MKRLYIVAFLCLFVYGRSDGKDTPSIIVCGDDKVLMIDEKVSDGDDPKIVWSWKAADVASQVPKVYQKRLHSIDECKPVGGGKNLLLTSSGGAVCRLAIFKLGRVTILGSQSIIDATECSPSAEADGFRAPKSYGLKSFRSRNKGYYSWAPCQTCLLAKARNQRQQKLKPISLKTIKPKGVA